MDTLTKSSEGTAQRGWLSRNYVLTALFMVVLVLIPIVLTPEFQITLLSYTRLYSLVALELALLTGVGGLTSFGQAAFVGLDAYNTAYLTAQYGVSPWTGLRAGLVIAVVSAYVISLITMRMSDHYLPLATIAWDLLLFLPSNNLEFPGKYGGLNDIPVLNMLGKSPQTGREMFYLIWAVAIMAMLAVQNLLGSRPGRAIRALRGDSAITEVMGVNIAQIKVVIFVFAMVLAYISSFLYAHLQRTVDPTPFDLNYGIEYLFMAVVGDVDHMWGAMLGAGLLTILKDSLQSILPKLLDSNGNFEIVMFDVLLVLLLQYARDDVWPLIRKLFPSPPATCAPDDAPALKQCERLRAGELILDVCTAHKELDGLVAVNDVGFRVKVGEIIGLTGPNGTGKSTTFNLVTGVLPVTRSEALYRGGHISGKPPYETVKRGIDRIFQYVQLLSDMTVLESVTLGVHLRDDFVAQGGVLAGMVRMNQAEEQKLLFETRHQLGCVGLTDCMYQGAGSLALGQQRTLETAHTLCYDPTLLPLDEPAAGLRCKEKQALAALLVRLKAEGMGVLLVEHDMDFVMNLTDRLAVVELDIKIAGRLPQGVQQNPAMLEAYLGGVK